MRNELTMPSILVVSTALFSSFNFKEKDILIEIESQSIDSRRVYARESTKL